MGFFSQSMKSAHAVQKVVFSVFSRALRFLVNIVNDSVDCVASKFLSFLCSVSSGFGSGVPFSIFLVSSSVMSSSLPVCVMTSLFAGQGAWHFMQPISVLARASRVHASNLNYLLFELVWNGETC